MIPSSKKKSFLNFTSIYHAFITNSFYFIFSISIAMKQTQTKSLLPHNTASVTIPTNHMTECLDWANPPKHIPVMMLSI